MTVVVTICSANYLAHAKVLGDSLAASNPDHKFVIGLVDRVPKELNLPEWLPYEVIPVEALGLPEFPEMAAKYNLVELNTAVKPFYLQHLYDRDPAVKSVMYLDPDILVLGSLKVLAEKLQHSNLVVTPHHCTFDHSERTVFYEIGMLSTGVYNLGFIATTRTETTFAFLKWWQKRLVDHCYYRMGSGVFVDQQWVTLAPLYFDGVHVEKDPGYNMCYWNHFERQLSRSDGRYLVNGKHELVFYHFSNYNPLKPEAITNRASQAATFAERPDLQPLYDDYRQRLLAAGYATVKTIKCAFGQGSQPVRKPAGKFKTTVQRGLKKGLGSMPAVIQKPLKRAARFVADNSGH